MSADDDLDVQPLILADLDPEERAVAEAALERIAAGTAQPVSHAEVMRKLHDRESRLAG